MKALIVCLIFISQFAIAEDWRLFKEAESGDRVLVDLQSFELKPYAYNDVSGKQLTAILGAIRFKYITKSGNTLSVLAAIDAEECIAKNEGYLISRFADGTSNTRYWSHRGTKIYDEEGSLICRTLKRLAADASVKDSI